MNIYNQRAEPVETVMYFLRSASVASRDGDEYVRSASGASRDGAEYIQSTSGASWNSDVFFRIGERSEPRRWWIHTISERSELKTVMYLYEMHSKNHGFGGHLALLESIGIYWNLLESIGIYWNLLESIGIYWKKMALLLESIGIYWNLLEFIGIHWNPLESIGQ